jgi:hypothetical protein
MNLEQLVERKFAGETELLGETQFHLEKLTVTQLVKKFLALNVKVCYSVGESTQICVSVLLKFVP